MIRGSLPLDRLRQALQLVLVQARKDASTSISWTAAVPRTSLLDSSLIPSMDSSTVTAGTVLLT